MLAHDQKSYAREEIKLTLDLVSQLLEGVQTQKKTMSIPDTQRLKITASAPPPVLPPGRKLSHLIYLKNAKSKVCFRVFTNEQDLSLAQDQVSNAIAELEASIREEISFISTFGNHYRKRLWILQSRNTRLGQQFYINYGFKNGIF